MAIHIEVISELGEDALEVIWNNTNDAIFTLGQDGAVLNANPSFTAILDWAIDEIKGVTPPSFLYNISI
ncbi:PAS domain S-box protein [Alkalihalobacillus deserti]|uniref:PAS domain S-box protein n=1 Tax=Alkalihalobacillus deserti TaxID=2879466 RepID=UPI001D147C0E|nr:PAS domain S-box protein [Alkalihalobacillus deserti]